MDEDTSDWNPICVASTENNEDSRGLGTTASAESGHHQKGPNYYKGAEWSVAFPK